MNRDEEIEKTLMINRDAGGLWKREVQKSESAGRRGKMT